MTVARSEWGRTRSTEIHRDMDKELVSAAQAGSTVAFEALYAVYARTIYRVALSITRNPADAEDATQETFLKAYLGIEHFRREAQFSSWLTRIAINSSLSFLRKRRTKREFSMQDYLDSDDKIITLDPVDARPSPERLLYLKQIDVGVEGFIEVLPNHLRMVVELRFLREQSMQEISTVLGISISATKSRLYRARKLMASKGLARQLRHNQPDSLIAWNTQH